MAQRTLLSGLLKFYFNVESAYYELMDSVDGYLPVYSFLINPLENNGIPSFPVYSVITLLVLGFLLSLGFSTSPAFATLELRVASQDGVLLSGVSVTALEGSREVARGVTDVGRLYLSLPASTSEVVVRFDKTGFETQSKRIALPSKTLTVTLAASAALANSIDAAQAARGETEQQASEFAREGYPEFQRALQRIESGGST